MQKNGNKLVRFKVVFVGDQGVGKTSIITRFMNDQFDQKTQPTIGIDLLSKAMQVEGEIIRLQLWDTAGQQRFRSLIPSYIRDSHVVIIVYDVSDMKTFESIPKWIDSVRQLKGDQGLVVLVGNKIDSQIKQVPTQKGTQLADQNKMLFMQVSAKTGDNIKQMFRIISQQVTKQQKNSNTPPKQTKKLKQVNEVTMKRESKCNKC